VKHGRCHASSRLEGDKGNRHREDNLRDFEGALLSRGQFLRGEVDLLVMGIKPDLHSYFPMGELHFNPFFNCLSCLGMSGRSLFASSVKEFKSFVESRKEHFSDWWVSLGLEAHHE